MKKPFSLPASERIKRKKNIDTLFQNGKAYFSFPYKVIYSTQPLLCDSHDSPLQVAISVPKRLFKKAHDRNRLKRITKECYRLQKQALSTLLHSQNQSMLLLLLYTHPEEIPYAQLSKHMEKALTKLQDKVNMPTHDTTPHKN